MKKLQIQLNTMSTQEEFEKEQSTQSTPQQDMEVTNEHVAKTISWDSISHEKLNISENHRVCLGTTGQIIKAIHTLYDRYNNTSDEYKKPENKYQESLYPNLSNLANEVCTTYENTFIQNVTDNVQMEVFGANLNGVRNDGTLRHPISTSDVPKNLKYKFAQFKQLLRVLTQRLHYIATRIVDGVERYKNDQAQRGHFIELQTRCVTFLQYLNGQISTVNVHSEHIELKDTSGEVSNIIDTVEAVETTIDTGVQSVTDRWDEIVLEARKFGNVTPHKNKMFPKQIKLTSEEAEKRSLKVVGTTKHIEKDTIWEKVERQKKKLTKTTEHVPHRFKNVNTK